MLYSQIEHVSEILTESKHMRSAGRFYSKGAGLAKILTLTGALTGALTGCNSGMDGAGVSPLADAVSGTTPSGSAAITSVTGITTRRAYVPPTDLSFIRYDISSGMSYSYGFSVAAFC